MITYIVGDLFTSPAQVLVNTVNTVGVMGKGIAKTFKQIYPEMFERYRHLCDTQKLTVGKLWLYKTPNKWILNFPTKTTWRQPSKIEYIEAGLKKFVNGYSEQGINSIAFPTLGCGNGELNWENQVRPLMEKYLKTLPIEIFIYLYKKEASRPEHREIEAISAWLRSEPSTLGFSEVWSDLISLISQGIELTSFYKKQLFRVEKLKGDMGIQIGIENKIDYLYYEELLNFWGILRSYGFVIPSVIPPEVSSYSDYLLSIFLELPYCREIIAIKDYEGVETDQARGIQYFPHFSMASALFNESPKQLIAI